MKDVSFQAIDREDIGVSEEREKQEKDTHTIQPPAVLTCAGRRTDVPDLRSQRKEGHHKVGSPKGKKIKRR
jgi:hypothetical protein